jgi:hypothetical protein
MLCSVPRGASPAEAAKAYVYLVLNGYATGQIGRICRDVAQHRNSPHHERASAGSNIGRRGSLEAELRSPIFALCGARRAD